MRFLVALASVVLGVALAAGFIYRDKPNAPELAIAEAPLEVPAPAPARPTLEIETSALIQQSEPNGIAKMSAPAGVAEIAAAQPTILNADRSRFAAVVTAPAPVPVSQGDDVRSRRVLVLALQGELRRVGCYKGAINGKWTTASKSALYWFLKRQNAKIPVNEPEEAQLNLLKSANNDYCAENEVAPDFVTNVRREDNVAAGVPNPVTTIDSTAFSDARRRAGVPTDGRIALDNSGSIALPEPMAVGRVEPEQKKRRYRSRSTRQVENLFKHPLGRF